MMMMQGLPLEDLIRKVSDPLKAKKLGEDPDHPVRSDWDEVKNQIM